MTKLFGFLSLGVFAFSAIVHALTFVPSVRISMGYTWPLHLATLAMFGVMVISMSAVQKRRAGARESGFFRRIAASQRENKEFFGEMRSFVPRYIYYAGMAVVAYVAINFLVFAGKVDGGTPDRHEGKFYLTNHGKVIREISESEFYRFEAYEVRGFSGHWMIFSMLPVGYFLFVERRLREKYLGDDGRGES